jgi:hypothetical protein
VSDEFRAGLADDDSMSSFPSAANPLDQLGLDPDQVRANPELLSSLSSGRQSDRGGPTQAKARLMQGPGAVAMPGSDTPSPSATSAGAAGGAGTAPVSPDPETVGMNALTTSLGNESKLANAVPTSDPDVTRLTAQQQALSKKEPLYDPQTGKMLEGDKPSTGARIWRGVRGGLTGLAIGGIPGAVVGAVDPGKITGEGYGAPNKAYQRREQTREQQLGATDTSLENARKNWKDAVDAMKTKGAILGDVTKTGSDIVSGSSKLELNDIKQQLANVAQTKEVDQKQLGLQKITNDLESKSRALDLKQMSLEQQKQIQDLGMQLREQKMQADRDKFAVGTDAKSLEAERKARLASIEDDWKSHPYWNKLTGNKTKEIQAVNDDINGRLRGAGINIGTTPAATPTAATPQAASPQKGFTRITASDGSIHDIPSRRLADARKRDPGLKVSGGQ